VREERSNSDLKGRTFLVTRTVRGNRLEREKLEKLGARVIELPLIEIVPPKDQEKINKAVEEIEKFDWIIFTSANGVISFFSSIKDKEEKKKKKSIRAKFACVGSETRRALEAEGFTASFVPSKFLTKSLAQELISKFQIKGKRVLLARAEEASREIATLLRNAGAEVLEAPAYSTKIRKVRNLDRKILDQITDITLTSPSTVRGLVANFSPAEIRSRNIRLHCIGPVTAEALRKEGLSPSSIPSIHTIDGMIGSLFVN
jgi:uroporphyrinogen III methyltransferase/synthase